MSLTSDHIAKLWIRMTRMFGHKWTSSYGTADDGTWLAGLSDLNVDDLKMGINTTLRSADEWPPSLPQFRNYCRPPATGHNTLELISINEQADIDQQNEYLAITGRNE